MQTHEGMTKAHFKRESGEELGFRGKVLSFQELGRCELERMEFSPQWNPTCPCVVRTLNTCMTHVCFPALVHSALESLTQAAKMLLILTL